MAKLTWTRAGQGTPEEAQAHAHDALGRLDVVTETKGAVTRVTDTDYDAEGRVVRIARPEGVLNYGYDEATGRHTKTWTATSEWGYGYDVLGRLVSVADAAGGTATFTSYDVAGSVLGVTTKQGAATVNAYDPVRHWLVGVTPTRRAASW